MPKTYVRKSAVKTHRKSEQARIKNKACRNKLATIEKSYRAVAAAEDKAPAQELFRKLSSAFDKAVKYGVIPKNRSNRKKSRLAALLKVAKPESTEAK